MQRLQAFWSDESGLVLSAELVFVTSIAAIGMIVGLSAARDGVSSELADLSKAIGNFNQGYQTHSIVGHGAAVSGSLFTDSSDYCEVAGQDTAATDEACITRVVFVGTEASGSPAPSIAP